MSTVHTENCRCGSSLIKLTQKLETVSGETVGYARLSCCQCGFTLNYPMRLPSSKTKDAGRIQMELVVLWNHLIASETIEKQLETSTAVYLKDDLVVSLMSLTKTIQAAEEHDYSLSADAKKKLWEALKQMKKVRLAIEEVEKSCEKHFQEVPVVHPTTEKIRSKIVQHVA